MNLDLPEKSRVRITALKAMELKDSAGQSLVKVETDAGLEGYGEAGASGPVVRAHLKDMEPVVLNEDPLSVERLYDTMASSQHTYRAHIPTVSGVDIALWDIKGKAAGMPVYKLLGGARNTVPCYITGGYYQEGKTTEDLTQECASYVDMGYNAIKLKIGGVSVEEDVERVGAVRETVGPNVDLMLDVNEGYDVPTAIRAAHLMEPFNIRWLEEPVHWYDRVTGLGQVAASTSIPIASGENAAHRWDARDLIIHGGIKVMQFDCTRSSGITECLKVASLCATQNVRLAPHHDPQIHGHLVAALPVGEILETFPTADRDPVWAELFSVRPEIHNSEMTLLDRPGWGIELNEDTLQARGVWA